MKVKKGICLLRTGLIRFTKGAEVPDAFIDIEVEDAEVQGNQDQDNQEANQGGQYNPPPFA